MKQLGGKLRQFFEEHQEAYSVNQLAEIFQSHDTPSFKLLIQSLAEMERNGEIRLTKKGQFQSGRSADQGLKGVFRQNDRGFGFVTIEGEEEDIFIPRSLTGLAMDGDEVWVKLTSNGDPFTGKGPEGEISGIYKRHHRQIIGVYHTLRKTGKGTPYVGQVIPRQKIWKDYSCYVLPGGIKAADDMVVSLEITDYPSSQSPKEIKGIISETLGHVDAPGTDILEVLVQKGVPTEFPDEVQREAQDVPDEIQPHERKNREDDRDRLVITIDGADAKDLDDAVSLKRLENGNFCLTVYIADVSHYVREGTALDNEALNRGTSVYVTDRVVPMLPQRLSNGICSLHPHVDRSVQACEMIFNQKGQRLAYRLYETVINSSFRMTYSDVNDILAGQHHLLQTYQAIVPMLLDMQLLSQLLITKRQRRGAIDFNTEEAEIQLNREGYPIKIVKRQRGKAERLIESFMLAANETVAYHFTQEGLPFLYRIHEKPAAERVERFREFIQAFGLSLETTNESVSPKELQRILKASEGEAFEPMVSSMMLRSMKQARYANAPSGHFGLASADYTHFTSPIRRYPDLMVHRLIREYGFMKKCSMTEEQIGKKTGQLESIADRCSQFERRAVEAERESDAMKKAEFMQAHVGEEFDGVISSVTNFGFFVELENTIEGLVRLASISGDYYHFIENHMLLIGERTGEQFRIGDRVRVKVTRADKATREVDFELVEAYDHLNGRKSVVDRSSRNVKKGKKELKQAKSSLKKAKRKKSKSSKDKNNRYAKDRQEDRPKLATDSGPGFQTRKRRKKKGNQKAHKSKKHLDFGHSDKKGKVRSKKRHSPTEGKRRHSEHGRRTPR